MPDSYSPTEGLSAKAKPERLSSREQRDVLDTLMVLTAMALNVNLPPSVVARARAVLETYVARISSAAADSVSK